MRRAIRGRLRLLAGILFTVALLLVLRLYFVQVVHGSDYSLRAEKQYVSASQKLFDRGSIYFTRKDGTVLSAAALATGFTIAMNPGHVEDAQAAYEKLAPLITIDQEAFFASANAKDDPYEVIAKRVSEDAGRAVEKLDIPGIQVERERWRTYPASTRAAQSIGFVAFDDDNTLEGRFGLERYYNDILSRGSVGLFGNFFAELFASAGDIVVDARGAREGDLVTTIEPVVQEKLDQVLAEINAQYGSRETGAIIMDPKTGEIVALDTAPSFDANDFSNGDPEHFGNPLVGNQYEFGSIVKALTMAAGLDSGAVTADSTYVDTGCRTLNNKKFCNYDLKARGVTPMQEVLSQSLNMGASYIALEVGHEKFRGYLKKLGMGTETGIDLPSEVGGDIHNIESSPRDVEYATASFGQGIAQTPVQMVRALGALANGGQVVTPHLVRAIRLESGVEKKLSWGTPERVFSSKATEDTTRMLVKVVDTKLANGTLKIPEMSVAAKTGTAQVAGSGGKYAEGRYFHSFFGYFPAYDPEFVIVMYTREPQGVQYASETLTKPFMELTHFLINYYEIRPDRAEY
ncbi:MAG: cell division protein FtsI (penicillin-binding protein 3) [Parcubacteria bacterium C7867-004]|nr:MAG: cell division protein FtsI (penicillin-binding protein 3) [Parcubacteria bacterium C7867-004]